MEYGLKQEGLLSFVRELNGNEDESYDNYLKDASMYARGEYPFYRNFMVNLYFIEILHSLSLLFLVFPFFFSYFMRQWLFCLLEECWCENLC